MNIKVIKILDNIEIVEEPNVPFPQANNLERIIHLVDLICEGPLSAKQIKKIYSFNLRQVHYYVDACIYLGLVKKSIANSGIIYEITNLGNAVYKLNIEEKNLFLVERILEHKIFNDVFRFEYERKERVHTDKIISIMLSHNLKNLGKNLMKDGSVPATYKRRASTIRQWINYAHEKLESFN